MREASTPTSFTSRVRRRARWLVAAGLAIAILAIVLYVWALPAIVRAQIAATFREAGIPNASFALQSASLTRSSIAQVRLGEPHWFNARQITIGYSLSSIWHGRIETLHLSGVEWTVGVDDDGSIDFGPTLAGGSSVAGELPFERIQVDDAVAIIAWRGRELRVPFAASIAASKGQTVSVQMQTNAVAADLGDITVITDSATASATIAFPATLDSLQQGQISLKNMGLHWTSLDLAISGANLDMPIGHAIASSGSGMFDVSNLTWRGTRVAGPNGSISLVGNRLDVNAHWSPFEDGEIAVDGWINLSNNPLAGQLTVSTPEPLALSETTAWLEQWPNVRNAEIGGRVSLNGQIELNGAAIQTSLRIQGESLSMRSENGHGMQIEDASASVILDGFNPLSTLPDQQIAIHKGRVGTLEVTDGHVHFELVDPAHVEITSAQWSLGEMGQFIASPFQLDLNAPVIRTRVSGSNIRLGPWLKLLTSDRVRGSGTLEGLLTLRVRPTEEFAVEMGEGVLEAVGEKGYLQVRDPQTVNALVERMDVGGDERLAQVRDQIVAAVQDFEFTMFRVEFVPEADEVLCRIETKGVGRTGPNPQEIGGAVVNIHNFDDVLRAVIWGSTLYD